MDRQRSCFFTGHRKIAVNKVDIIKEMIDDHIENLIVRYDVKDFITGGALGFDTIAAEAVIKLKAVYPDIKLHLYSPCYDQCRKWNKNQKYRYRIIRAASDEILDITNEKYTKNCMHLRNMRMINDAYFCIAFCARPNSGAGVTLRKALSAGAEIINIADEIFEK